MRPILILLLLLYCIRVSAQPGEQWYRVVKSSSNLWDTGSNLFVTHDSYADSVRILGFTNMGAQVLGTVKEATINIPLQTRTITPYGGDGLANWDITLSATGAISDSLLSLQFYFHRDTFQATGSITARRWTTSLDKARLKYQRAYPDTLVNGMAYHYRLYDDTGQLIALGQDYRQGIKNGRWIFLENSRTVYHEAGYLNDTLHGWYLEGLVTRHRGVYLKGVKTGKWLTLLRKRRHWIVMGFENYDNHGRLLSKGYTYSSDQASKEIFYDDTGREVWFIYYNKKGTVVYEAAVDMAVLLESTRIRGN